MTNDYHTPPTRPAERQEPEEALVTVPIKPRTRLRTCFERAAVVVGVLLVLLVLLAICVPPPPASTYDNHGVLTLRDYGYKVDHGHHDYNHYHSKDDLDWDHFHQPTRVMRSPGPVWRLRMLLGRLSMWLSRLLYRQPRIGPGTSIANEPGRVRRVATWITELGFIADLREYMKGGGDLSYSSSSAPEEGDQLPISSSALPPPSVSIPILVDNRKHRHRLASVVSHLNKHYYPQARFEPVEEIGDRSDSHNHPVMLYVSFAEGGRELEFLNRDKLRTCGRVTSGSCFLLFVNSFNSLTMLRSELKEKEWGIMTVSKVELGPEGKLLYTDESFGDKVRRAIARGASCSTRSLL